MSKPCGKFHGNYQIARIVGEVHVGLTDDEVIRHVRGRLRPGAWEQMPKQLRRMFTCEVLRVHHANQKLYRDVMRGRF